MMYAGNTEAPRPEAVTVARLFLFMHNPIQYHVFIIIIAAAVQLFLFYEPNLFGF